MIVLWDRTHTSIIAILYLSTNIGIRMPRKGHDGGDSFLEKTSGQVVKDEMEIAI